MTTRPARVRFAAGMVAVALSAVACGSTGDRSTADEDALDAIRLESIGEAPSLRLGDSTATPLVVNVWATWCAPCRKEMPAFDAVANRYDGSVRFVGINLGDKEDAAQRFIDETGVTFDQYLDPDSTVQQAFSITGMPATAFIRADGTVATVHNGALDEAELEALLEDRLGLDPPSAGG